MGYHPATTASKRPTLEQPVLHQPTLWGEAPLGVSPIEQRWVYLDEASAVLHAPLWLRGADRCFSQIEAAIRWTSSRRVMYDRLVEVPRLTASHDRARGAGPPCLEFILTAVEAALGVSAEHIGLNHYRSGADSVAWHRDRIGRDRDWSIIALVSLGGPRTLRLRPWSSGVDAVREPSVHARSYSLASGDLFIMAGACQRDWEHAVLKTATASPRISIAIRSKQFPQGPQFPHVGVPPLRLRRKLQ